MKALIKKLLRESLNTRKINYKFEHLDSYDGQNNWELGVYLENTIIGMVQYVTYGGELTISDIVVRPEYRRKGFASKMVKVMKNKHPDFKYVPSMKTDLGAKFKHKDIDDLDTFNSID